MVRRSAPAGAHGLRRASPGRFLRVRALLAGALVLGVGGTLTLAAWTDTEVAQGSFAASTFGIVGSTDGTTFVDHPAGSPAALSFTTPVTAMSPGTTVYSRFVVKTTGATGVTGKLALGGAGVTGTGLGAYLQYGVRIISAAGTCDATSFGGSSSVVVASGSALSTAGTGTQNLAAAGASPVAYCFAVTLPAGTSGAAQGLTATATWTFTATSDS